MYSIFEALPIKGGKYKVKFLKENIYKIIRTELNIFYIRFNNEGRYIRKLDTGFGLLIIEDVRDEFRSFFENNFEKIENLKSVSLHDFTEEFFMQRPIRDNNIIKSRLMLKAEFVPEEELNYIKK